MSITILPGHAATFTVAASDKIATYSLAPYEVTKVLGFPNYPDANATVFSGSGANTTAAFSAATQITIAAGNAPVLYQTGTGPVIVERENYQAAPAALNTTGTLTAAMILGGIVTSTTAAGVTATLNTGAVMDAVIDMAIDDSFDWAAISTGANTFTVTAAASGHTVVGSGAVATATSGLFRTRKTAAETYVTYRIG